MYLIMVDRGLCVPSRARGRRGGVDLGRFVVFWVREGGPGAAGGGGGSGGGVGPHSRVCVPGGLGFWVAFLVWRVFLSPFGGVLVLFSY